MSWGWGGGGDKSNCIKSSRFEEKRVTFPKRCRFIRLDTAVAKNELTSRTHKTGGFFYIFICVLIQNSLEDFLCSSRHKNVFYWQVGWRLGAWCSCCPTWSTPPWGRGRSWPRPPPSPPTSPTPRIVFPRSPSTTISQGRTRQQRFIIESANEISGFLRMHCNENPIYVFLFWELHGLTPNFRIHVSVSDLYILLGLPLFGQAFPNLRPDS